MLLAQRGLARYRLGDRVRLRVRLKEKWSPITMRNFRVPVLGVGIFCCLSSLLFGQEFSADLISNRIESNETSTPGKIYVGKDKIRLEPKDSGGMSAMDGVMIVDLSTQTSVILLPQRHVYIESMPGQVLQRSFSFFRPAAIEDACPDWQKQARKPGGSCHKVGHEMVNGRDAVKYEGTSAEGETGAVWLDTKLRFVVQCKGKNSGDELRNIQEGSQPGSLFEIPADYQKMDVGGMMTRPTPPNP
jgi:hypothetical protein